MGRTTTPTYRTEYTIAGGRVAWTPAAWDTRHEGRPTDETLAEHIRKMEQSTEAGGVNEHLGRTTIRTARVIRQSSDETVATYTAPLFEAITASRALACRHCGEAIAEARDGWEHEDGFPYCKNYNEEMGPETRRAEPAEVQA